MNESENTSKTGADVAHFYQALGSAHADGMPMPFEVHFLAGGSVMLRYRTVEEVGGAAEHIGARAGHDSHTHKDARRKWHSYGTRYGGGQGVDWAGWPVEVWAAVDGPGVKS